MKKLSKILWGLALIAIGGIFALNAFGITDIEVFFDGWWTLFNIIGLLIGVFLLLCCQNVLGFDMLWKLAIPAIIVIIGLKLIFNAVFGDKAAKMIVESRQNGNDVKTGCATFSGQDMNFDGEKFDGAEISAIFGGVKCDLRNAIIEKDCAVTASAIFGGIDIYVPDNVNVKISSNSIFGGVSEKKHRPYMENAVTLYINATCIFGGAEIK